MGHIASESAMHDPFGKSPSPSLDPTQVVASDASCQPNNQQYPCTFSLLWCPWIPDQQGYCQEHYGVHNSYPSNLSDVHACFGLVKWHRSWQWIPSWNPSESSLRSQRWSSYIGMNSFKLYFCRWLKCYAIMMSHAPRLHSLTTATKRLYLYYVAVLSVHISEVPALLHRRVENGTRHLTAVEKSYSTLEGKALAIAWYLKWAHLFLQEPHVCHWPQSSYQNLWWQWAKGYQNPSDFERKRKLIYFFHIKYLKARRTM